MKASELQALIEQQALVIKTLEARLNQAGQVVKRLEKRIEALEAKRQRHWVGPDDLAARRKAMAQAKAQAEATGKPAAVA